MSSPFTAVLQALHGQRLELHNEKALQLQLAARFAACGLEVKREKILDDKNTIDFYFPDGLGVEVKIAGAKTAIFRQCERYCAHPDISALLLVTSKLLGFPPTIHHKPVRIFSLGTAWL